jgi:hypothetical protein
LGNWLGNVPKMEADMADMARMAKAKGPYFMGYVRI